MRTPVSFTRIRLVAGLLLVFIFSFVQTGKSQCPADPEPQQPCPPQRDCRTENPKFPGCQPPGNLLKVLLVLDESFSIANSSAEDDVENAVNLFASTLHTNFPTPGKVQLRIIEFSNDANDAVPLTDVADGGFTGAVSAYLSGDGGAGANYDPDLGGDTDFEAALNKAAGIPGINIIFFFTDGIPTDGNTTRTTLIEKANNIKCAGTYIFAIGVSNGANEERIQDLSHTDKLFNPGAASLIDGADYSMQSFSNFGNLLTELANSLIDVQPPTVGCPPTTQVVNKPGECGNNVNFNANPTDNCPGVTVTCVPPSGHFFPVGVTTVTCTAKDGVGLTASCSFKITVLDMEAPNIVCPGNKTISCEESVDPANLGTPIALDNCGIASVMHADARTNGSCVNDFSIQRTWAAADIHGNARTCIQTIKVEDKKSPVIACPPNITVTCDTSVVKTGMANATDNCTARPVISWSNVHVSGDCEWFCITDRTFVAKDECQNTSKCLQRITKDVTPLIEQALAGGPLKFGQTAATVTLSAGHGNCVVKWLPYTGSVPKALPFDDAVAGDDCKLMSNPMNASGQLENPLLGETIKLSLLVRLNPALGTRKLSTFPCTLPFIVKQAMAPNADVNELIRVTNLTLGNINVSLNVPAHCLQLLNYIKCINGGFTVCKPN